jgi:hypothetical protein
MNVRLVAARRPAPPTAWPATASAPFQARRRAATSPPLWTTSTSTDRDDSFATEAAASGASRRPPLAPELDESEQRPTRGAGTCWLLLSTRMRASPPPGRCSRPLGTEAGPKAAAAIFSPQGHFPLAPAAHDRRIPSTADDVGDEREQETRDLAGRIRRNHVRPRATARARGPTGSERRIAARAETAPCAHGRASARADEGTVIRGVICTDDGATRSAARSSQTSLPPASERNRRLTWPAS